MAITQRFTHPYFAAAKTAVSKPRLAAAAKEAGRGGSASPAARSHTHTRARDTTFEGAASQRSAGLRSHTVQGTLTLEVRGNPTASMLPLCRRRCCSCPTCPLLANWTRDTSLRWQEEEDHLAPSPFQRFPQSRSRRGRSRKGEGGFSRALCRVAASGSHARSRDGRSTSSFTPLTLSHSLPSPTPPLLRRPAHPLAPAHWPALAHLHLLHPPTACPRRACFLRRPHHCLRTVSALHAAVVILPPSYALISISFKSWRRMLA